MAVFGDVDIILNANSTDSPVLLQSIHIDILLQIGILEERLDDETAEINLYNLVSQRTLRHVTCRKNLRQAQP
jgi:hypothetical protein